MSITFGLAIDFRSAEHGLDEQLDRVAALAQVAEQQGFDSISAGESYPTGPGGGHLPSGLLALSALASRTRLRLGTGVILLPAWNLLRLAYDCAVIDQISAGRFFLGVGVSSPSLQRRFGIDPERVGDYIDDMLAGLRALWSGANGYQGKYIQADGAVGVRPAQPGGPPIWVGGSIRRSVQRAAVWGHGYIASSNYTFDLVARQANRHRAALAARGTDPASARVMANRLTLVADTEAEARRDARKYVGAVLQSYARVGALSDDPRVKSAPPEDLFEEFDADWCLVGTPDQVAERVRRYADAGVTHIQARVLPAEIPPDLAARTVALLGRSVLPAFG